jgi:hypothetical protein
MELQTELPPMPTTIPQVPFFVEADEADVLQPTDQEEEEYRRKALDYNLGHIATKVKETSSKRPSRAAGQSSQLLQAMLKSVSVVAADIETGTTHGNDPPPPPPSATKAVAEKLPLATQSAKPAASAPTPRTPSAAPATVPVVGALSDDEEEEPMQLKSEFQAVVSKHEPPGVGATAADDDDDDEVDDLAAAIKSKRKKKSKK